jgi:endonuclease-3
MGLMGERSKAVKIVELMKGHYPEYLQHDDGNSDPFRTLIGCVLSQRTRDINAERASEALFEVADTPLGILEIDESRLRELIRCSGFYNQKAKHVHAICHALIEDFNGLVPWERQTLMSLPGVGPKTSDIVLSHAYNTPAIAVDVHVSRVAKRLGLAERDASPEGVKLALEDVVPREIYRFVDSSFVRHGKEICLSRNPRCDSCFLDGLCNYFEDEALKSA